MTDSVRKRLADMERLMNEERENNRREMEDYFAAQRERIERERVERNQHAVDFINSLFNIK